MFASPPPPPSPIGDETEKSTSADDDDGLLALLVLLILLCPLGCAVYVCFRFPGRKRLYLRYRFSHSNPHVLFFYVPEEARGRMRSVLYGRKFAESVDVNVTKTHPDLKQDIDTKEDVDLAKGKSIEAGAPGPSTEAGAPGPSTDEPFEAGRVERI